jgi:macrolide-specific efflux system membrane fusion protein
MKSNKLWTVSLLLLLLLVGTSSLYCSTSSNSTTTIQQIVTVQKGTLKKEVTATGNLALSQTADLAFDVSGYVYKITVDEGDSVKKGQVVAEVDPSDWENQKSTYERNVVNAKINVNTAQINLEKAQNPTTSTSTISGSIAAPDPLDIETKKLQLQVAKMAVTSAENELARYLQTSSQITAPFDGFITKVNLQGGAEIFKGAVAVSMADPTKFKTDIYISEMDINQIQIGMNATVQLMSSTISTFPGKVTAIAPTATNSSGVINYKVQIDLLSAEEAKQFLASQTQTNSMPQQQGQPPSGQAPAGQPPSGQPPSGQSSPGQSTKTVTSGSTSNTPLTLDQLRDGLSVTVNVTIQEKQNVLMVANKAITSKGANKIVRIPTGKTTEDKVVKTGISNSQYTEIVEGLSEGDQVAIVTTTTSTSTTTSKQSGTQGMGGMGSPGGGSGPPPF